MCGWVADVNDECECIDECECVDDEHDDGVRGDMLNHRIIVPPYADVMAMMIKMMMSLIANDDSFHQNLCILSILFLYVL